MSFLSPAFLLGLVAIGIPVLIHLSRRRAKQSLSFPSLMFIQQVPYRSMRRRRLRDLLLLALRCGAIALLAFAFARPLTSSDQSLAVGERQEELIVLLDRSYSMTYQDRWSRAIEAVKERVRAIGRADRVTLVAFDESAAALNEPTSDPAEVVALLDALEPSDRVTRYGPALRLARTLALDSSLPSRRVFLVSDFQRNGFAPDSNQRLPPGIQLDWFDAGADEDPAEPLAGAPVPSEVAGNATSNVAISNVAITEVTLDRQREGARERVSPSARLAHQGSGSRDLSVSLAINGRVVETKPLELGPDSAEKVVFTPLVLETGITTRGEVQIADDPIAADNVRRFALSESAAIPVLVIDRGRRGPNSLYLLRALETSRRPAFAVTVRTAADLRPDDFSGPQTIVLHDAVQQLDDAVKQKLSRFVEDGGGVLMALGDGYGENGAIATLGLAGVEAINDSRVERHLAQIDLGHEIFAPFAATRSGDFSRAQFFRYRPLKPEAEDAVLARFDNGDVALLERSRGRGKILIWSGNLDGSWSDLVLQGLFVPWVDRAVRYLAAYSPSRESYQVGQVAALEVGDRSADRPWLVLGPQGDRTTLQATASLLIPLDRKGFWEARPVDSDRAPAVLAVNVDVTESDLRRFDPEELVLAWTQGGETAVVSEDEAATGDPSRQKIWWAVLLGLLLLLGAESLLANRRPGGLRALPTEN